VRSFTRPETSFLYPYVYCICLLYPVCASERHAAVREM